MRGRGGVISFTNNKISNDLPRRPFRGTACCSGGAAATAAAPDDAEYYVLAQGRKKKNNNNNWKQRAVRRETKQFSVAPP